MSSSTITAHPARTRSATVGDYVALTKPRIVELLLVTTLPAMIAAAGGWPGLRRVAGTLVAGALVSGSAHATNMVLDRDLDAQMSRTANRPLPAGRVTPNDALAFAVALLVAGTVLMALTGGPLATALTAGAWLWYVGLYTCVLKRRTPQNIVIGGVAGAMPPLIGWAAVTGRVAAAAVVMFAIVVAWTPIHFWALAVATGGDYARAGVPMLPAVVGDAAAARRALGYAAATVALSFALPLSGVGGGLLAGVLAVCGAWFLFAARAFAISPSPAIAWRTFHRSNAYLATVFLAIAVAGWLT
ncbi:MAG: heme o synthase [Nitriliruptoraceae bacterium]